MTRQEARGATAFTLIEVMVGLAIGGVCVLGAASLLTELADRATGIVSTSRRVNRDANAERTLEELTANLSLPIDATPTLTGDTVSTAFRSWCGTADGWMARCDVILSFENNRGSVALTLRLSGAETTVTQLRTGLRAGSFRYLVDPAHGGAWSSQWSRPEPPAAILAAMDSDTLLLRLR